VEQYDRKTMYPMLVKSYNHLHHVLRCFLWFCRK
jgi:hypothetical protein